VLERTRVREVAGVFRSPGQLEEATADLLRAGFDRADLSVMSDIGEVVRKIGAAGLTATELADVPATPRRALVRPEDVVLVSAGAIAMAAFLGAAACALAVIASRGNAIQAALAALGGGAAAGALAAYFAHRFVSRVRRRELRTLVEAGGIVLWVRVTSRESEQRALAILRRHGAAAAHVHEIEIEKHTDDVPLSSVRPDPLLGNERLGDPER
jgi:hypothetical protein